MWLNASEQTLATTPEWEGEFATLISNAYSSQAKIGWRNFLKGRISNVWSPLFEAHLRNINSKLSHSQCSRALIKALWKHHRRVWKVRCNTLHADDNELGPRHQREQLQLQIESIWNSYNPEWELDREDQRIFSSRIRVEEMPLKCQINWANLASQKIRQYQTREFASRFGRVS